MKMKYIILFAITPLGVIIDCLTDETIYIAIGVLVQFIAFIMAIIKYNSLKKIVD